MIHSAGNVIWIGVILLCLEITWLQGKPAADGFDGFPTAKTASFATTNERVSNGTREASTYNRNQNRNAAYPTMTDGDKRLLMSNCGDNYNRGRGDFYGVQQKINKFGAKQVIKARRKDKFKRTCLHFAALFDHSNILTLLIKTGLAGLDVKDYYKETPLRMAIRRRKYASITTLVKFGASLAKTKLSNFKRHAFNKAVEEEKTKAAIAKGQRLSDPKWNLEMEFRSNSTWSDMYAAEEATKFKFNYWCSARGDNAPIYWQISFTEVQVQIVRVEFEEQYPGAEFQFFASNDAQNCNVDEVLISGTREDINGIEFENDQSYPCYGLKIIQLANTKNLASLKNFEFFLKDSKWNLEMEFRSDSTWSNTYAAEEATKFNLNYWCSARKDDAPIYWRISFTEVQVQIVRVEFEEEYPGAEFQFFASNDAQNCNMDEVLISGTREDINGIEFENDQSYPCYGLKIIQLANTKNYGPLASLKNFEFFLKDEMRD